MTTAQLILSLFIMSGTAMGMLTAGAITLLRPIVTRWVTEDLEPLRRQIEALPGVYYTRSEFDNYESEQIFRMNAIARSVNKIESRVEWLYQERINDARYRGDAR